MNNGLFESGVIPIVNNHILAESKKRRDYGEYWSASSAGYCMRLNIFRRLGVPMTPEMEEKRATTQRLFSVGHIFHGWIQELTKEAGVSVASEVELIDDDLMIKGHFDDLIKIQYDENGETPIRAGAEPRSTSYILYDYKTANSQSFSYASKRPMGRYHKYQLGTYMYMLRQRKTLKHKLYDGVENLSEARILSISKDDLRMQEKALIYNPLIENDIKNYWKELNNWWNSKKLPPCTCKDHDGGFMGKRSAKGKVYNDFFYEDEPCSIDWFTLMKKEGKVKGLTNGE